MARSYCTKARTSCSTKQQYQNQNFHYKRPSIHLNCFLICLRYKLLHSDFLRCRMPLWQFKRLILLMTNNLQPGRLAIFSWLFIELHRLLKATKCIIVRIFHNLLGQLSSNKPKMSSHQNLPLIWQKHSIFDLSL